MTYDVFTDAFLDAVGAWQRGWKEQPDLRKELTRALLKAIGETRLPPAATSADEICYRKRFLFKDNPESGGDHVPILVEGRYDEGVASWSTEFEWLKTFKGEFKENANTAIFAHRPEPSEVILNIKALWQVDGFAVTVEDYKKRGGKEADALLNFRDDQFEVILNAPLLVDDIEAFCGPVGTFDQLFKEAGVVDEKQEDALVEGLKEINRFPGDAHWLQRDAAQRVVTRTLQKFWEKVEASKSR